MRVIKRNGLEVDFNANKIKNAIEKANNEVEDLHKIDEHHIQLIIEKVIAYGNRMKRAISVEEIQDLVENSLMLYNSYRVARAYIRYRYDREKIRNRNTIDDAVLSLIECNNEKIKQENSNKNPTIISTQRDYMAGEVSKDLTSRYFLPKDIIEAHNEGLIHFHDMDYFAQKAHNCCLVNLQDMLQNGTVISGTMIEKPHKFSTACNIATQIIAQVASSQYGGQTITLSHLAPFVEESRKTFKNKYPNIDDELLNKMVKEDIKAGVQTIQYQVVTLMTTNGQAPFVTVYMDINEVDEKSRVDLALVIEEVLKQRIKGVKNEKGVYVTPAFPKLIYCLDENNIYPDSKYYYLTKLAAECTAKRMVPDYISAKMMRKLKKDVYPCMGCVDENEVITYKLFGNLYTESFKCMWNRLADHFEVKLQPNGKDFYMDTPNVKIYDQKQGFVDNYRIIKNHTDVWLTLTFSNGQTLICTPDHPFETENRGVILAEYLRETDIIQIDTTKTKKNICDTSNTHITRKEIFYKKGYSYDVTTESEHFTVSGLYSHNCRSFLTPDRFTEADIGNVSNALNYKKGEHKYYGRLIALVGRP